MEIKYAEREEGMRKQNSKFLTAFISEAGSELENNDYFAFVELDKYACYVIGDGLNDYSLLFKSWQQSFAKHLKRG